ncbi:hypothetical protein PH7735_03860 [Shimia thalassica]|uniref:Uncharacterized protein n=1 Tax=Shimia thalassica TaxID=1715693 RepID=A0A0P1IY64_9RHOB|nr:hypothetical protein PH7735_03860 [Shimia thalassica]
MGVRTAIEMEHLVSKQNTVLFNDLPTVSEKLNILGEETNEVPESYSDCCCRLFCACRG